MGDLSANFSTIEFKCKGHGQAGHVSHPTLVDGRLVVGLQKLRDALRGPLVVVSGHRCPSWNRQVGGAAASQHVLGRAADLPYGKVTVDQAAAAGFTGIGSSGIWAVHVDVRPRAARWRY